MGIIRLFAYGLLGWLDLKYNLIIFEDGRVVKKGRGALSVYP
jgi:hypothetical protein